jgi:GGDEF domain-containing protein
MTSVERPPLGQRLEALESGAWDYLGYPHGAEELLLKLDVFVRSKLESDRLEEAGLIDQVTGLYSLPGVQRRGEELDSQAYRNSDALACLVLAASSKGSPETGVEPELLRTVARAFRDTARRSDIIGRTEAGEFVVLAPNTDATGATRLAERFSGAADGLAHERVTSVLPLELRAGFDAVTNARATPRKAKDLLLHASVALGQAKSDPTSYWLKPFDGETEVAE